MEIVVAMGVFAVLALAAASSAIHSLGTSADNRGRVQATSVATEEVERVRAQFNTARGAIGSNCLTRAPVVVLADGRYTIACKATWLDASRNPGPAGSPLTAATGSILRVEVSVTWPNMGGVKPVINSTLLS